MFFVNLRDVYIHVMIIFEIEANRITKRFRTLRAEVNEPKTRYDISDLDV